MTAKGQFHVKVTPQPASEIAAAGNIQRLTIDKQWEGDLVGTSKGEMLAGGTEETQVGAYVAVERVTATVDGRSGTFIFLHEGVRGPTGQSLRVRVLPGSATGALAGLEGDLKIIIEGKEHRYEFDYTLPSA